MTALGHRKTGKTVIKELLYWYRVHLYNNKEPRLEQKWLYKTEMASKTNSKDKTNIALIA